MNFERTFVATSYALVGVAFFAVASSGQVGVIAPVAFVIAYVASLLWRRDGAARPQTARVWTGALLASLAALVLWSLDDGNWLLHALEFALLMTVSRLFQRRYAKDWLQLYALSFLLMLVAAVIHPTMVFAGAFLLYAVLAIWALVMLHIVRQIEIATRSGPEDEPGASVEPGRPWTDYLRPWRLLRPHRPPPRPERLPDGPIPPETLAWRRRELVRGRFLLGSSVMALLVLAASMLFFFLFPRIGMGFFFARTRDGQSVTGFTDEVKLGGFGRIKSSNEVVMRVLFPDAPERLERPVRLRGLSFDHFDGRSWSRSEEPNWALHQLGNYLEVPGSTPAGRDEVGYRARIYLEPLETETKVLFHPLGTRAVQFLDSEYDGMRGRRKRVFLSLSRDMTFRAPKDTSLSYLVEVVEPRAESVRRARLQAASSEVPRWVADRWTQLPSELDPRYKALASKLAGDGDRLGRVLAVEAALRRDWTYSLEGDQDNRAPLEDFVFGRRRGHCEYFATAMVVLLRTQGIAARVVNGFLGGERNGFGDYLMIKQADAHSWVEVYFPDHGWQTFDPTPAAGQLAPVTASVLDALRRAADGASLLWYTWVVEYDLERQVAVFRDIGRTLRRLGGGLRLPQSKREGMRRVDDPADAAAAPGSQDGSAPWWPWLAGALVVLAIVAWLGGRRRRGGRAFDARIARAVAKLDRALEGLGLGRAAHQSHHDVATGAVAAGHVELANTLRAFAAAWDRARWRDPDDLNVRAAALRACGDAMASAHQLRRDARRARLPQPAGAATLTGDAVLTPAPEEAQ